MIGSVCQVASCVMTMVLDCEQDVSGCNFHAIITMTNSRLNVGFIGYVLMVLLQYIEQGKVCAHVLLLMSTLILLQEIH